MFYIYTIVCHTYLRVSETQIVTFLYLTFFRNKIYLSYIFQFSYWSRRPRPSVYPNKSTIYPQHPLKWAQQTTKLKRSISLCNNTTRQTSIMQATASPSYLSSDPNSIISCFSSFPSSSDSLSKVSAISITIVTTEWLTLQAFKQLNTWPMIDVSGRLSGFLERSG